VFRAYWRRAGLRLGHIGIRAAGQVQLGFREPLSQMETPVGTFGADSREGL
jgi:hypothetical protein